MANLEVLTTEDGKLQVKKDGVLIGEVYYNASTRAYVAQLDEAISIRSESFRTMEQAIDSLINFDPSQLL